MRTIGVGNEDVFAVFVCDFVLCCMAERGKCDTKEYGDRERFYLVQPTAR
jgi:hypothetical protein